MHNSDPDVQDSEQTLLLLKYLKETINKLRFLIA